MDNGPEYYRDLPTYQNLTPEQKVTVDRWDAEKEKRLKLYEELKSVRKDSDPELFEKLLDQLRSTDAYYCEHGRSWAYNCIGCNKIEKVLRPELYCKAEDCESTLEEEDQESGYCECCREE